MLGAVWIEVKERGRCKVPAQPLVPRRSEWALGPTSGFFCISADPVRSDLGVWRFPSPIPPTGSPKPTKNSNGEVGKRRQPLSTSILSNISVRSCYWTINGSQEWSQSLTKTNHKQLHMCDAFGITWQMNCSDPSLAKWLFSLVPDKRIYQISFYKHMQIYYETNIQTR